MALDFVTASSQYVTHTDINAVDGAAAWTAMVWFKTDTAPGAGAVLVSKGAGGLAQGPMFYIDTSDLKCSIGDGSGVTSGTTTGGPLALATYYNAAAVFDGAGSGNAGRLKIYLNAVSQTLTFSGTIPAALQSTSDLVSVGGATNSAGRYFDGRLGLVKMWTGALSLAEIQNEMRSFRPRRRSNLQLFAPYYDGASVKDYSGNGFHGTLVNTPTASSDTPAIGGGRLAA